MEKVATEMHLLNAVASLHTVSNTENTERVLYIPMDNL